MERVVHKKLVSEIKIRAPRQRQDMGDLEGLAESLLKWGQLTPILIDKDDQLIAGERRLEAHKMNGMLHIDAIYRDEVTEVELEEIELEENVRRKQLTWQEENKAIARIHEIRTKSDPNWTQAQTAQLIVKPDQSAPQQRDVSTAITLEKMMKLFPEIAKAKNVSQAMNLAKAKAKNVERVVDVQQRPEVYKQVSEKIYHGDSVELIRGFEDECIDAIITDPPFGVDYDARVAGTVGVASAYEDDKKKYEYILTMIPDLYRVLRKDGWCVWFLGISWYEHVKGLFRQAGFTVDEIPIMWDRSDGHTFTNVPSKYFRKGYDIALHMHKGSPNLVKTGSNVLRIPPVETKDREALVERPVELYAELIQRLTIPGQTVADFFVGSGSCPAAAAMLKRDYVGIELSEERRAIAIQKIRAHIPTK